MLKRVQLVGVIALTLAAPAGFTQLAGATRLEHSVTGSGHVVEGSFESWQSVAVHQADDGSLKGVVQMQIDFHDFGLGQVAVHSSPTCLTVEGETAWIGSIVTHSTNEDVIAVGSQIITLVRDLGGNGEDVLHGEVVPTTTTCRDKPSFFETVVESGNLHVR